jgi:hypothetical protein
VSCDLCGGTIRRWTTQGGWGGGGGSARWQSCAIARGGAGGGGGGTASARTRCGRRLLVDLLYIMKQVGQAVRVSLSPSEA